MNWMVTRIEGGKVVQEVCRAWSAHEARELASIMETTVNKMAAGAGQPPTRYGIARATSPAW